MSVAVNKQRFYVQLNNCMYGTPSLKGLTKGSAERYADHINKANGNQDAEVIELDSIWDALV